MKQTHRPPRSIYPAQNRHMRRRTRVLAGLVAVLCFGGLLARLFTLQILDPSGYANRAAAQQLRDTTLPAARGEIYSADGVTLAASKTCWTIRASPRELADELVQPAAKALSEILDIDYDATLQKLSKRTSNDCLLRRRVDADLADAVRAWCTQNNAQGIQILQDTKRVYPQGNFMGCLLGFTDVDNQGLWGLELQYDAQLTGRNGTILTAKNAWGYDMPTHYSTLQDAVPGNDITLTIRADIQHYLESALSAAVAEHHVAARAVGIVMEVDTGAILAMSTKPDYDPNDPRTIVDETIRQQVNALSGEERSKALADRPAGPVAQQGNFRFVRTRQCVQAHHLRCGTGYRCRHRGTAALSARARSMWRAQISAAQTGISMAAKPWPRGWRYPATPALSRWGRGWANRTFAITLPPLACAPQPVLTCPARSSAANTIPPTAWARWSWLPAPSGKAAR